MLSDNDNTRNSKTIVKTIFRNLTYFLHTFNSVKAVISDMVIEYENYVLTGYVLCSKLSACVIEWRTN